MVIITFLLPSFPDISLLVEYMIDNSIFEEKLDCTDMQNNTAKFKFPNFYYIGSVHLVGNIVLSKYVKFAQGN